MSLNALAKRVHVIAKEKGWWDKHRTPLECHMLIVTEIAEATEAWREGKDLPGRDGGVYIPDLSTGKPEGEAVELADALIRILDYAESRGFDMDAVVEAKMAYNKTRPYRHGGKQA